ncbi:hypothetical protein B9T19_03570 [Ignatzschineria sp. F8392]|nr:hypothetical protein B9T19_03570 [Ignatzschineria sp. F8392]
MKNRKISEIRCVRCNKKLCEGDVIVLEIKCPRCKAINVINITKN